MFEQERVRVIAMTTAANQGAVGGGVKHGRDKMDLKAVQNLKATRACSGNGTRSSLLHLGK